MSDLIRNGIQWLNTLRNSALASTVAYGRVSDSVDVSATVGSTKHLIVSTQGFQTVVETRDYLITASQLVIASAQITPARGDKIRETINAQTHVFEVTEPGGEPCYRYCDATRQTVRVHTKYLKIEA